MPNAGKPQRRTPKRQANRSLPFAFTASQYCRRSSSEYRPCVCSHFSRGRTSVTQREMKKMRSNTLGSTGGRAITTRIGHCAITKTIYPESADLNIVVGRNYREVSQPEIASDKRISQQLSRYPRLLTVWRYQLGGTDPLSRPINECRDKQNSGYPRH
jgi:hypothetical protein